MQHHINQATCRAPRAARSAASRPPAARGGRGGGRGAGRGAGRSASHAMAEGPDDAEDQAVIPDAAWAWIATLGFGDILPSGWPSIANVPHRAADLFTECTMVALRRMLASPDSPEGIKLLFLLPQLLLCPLPRGEKGLQRVVIQRCRRFLRGEWEQLVRAPGEPQQRVQAEVTIERAAKDAAKLVKEGQFRRAVQRLELAHLAQPNAATVAALQALHPHPNPTIVDPQANENTPAPIVLLREYFDEVMADLPRASAPGPSQFRWEHLLAVYKGGGADMLFQVCSQLAAGELPMEARPWFGGARLVALLKDVDETGAPLPPPFGGVRPIACGEVIRKLVAKIICKQDADGFRTYLCPAAVEGEMAAVTQRGVAVPGGADQMVHASRLLLEIHPEWVLVKVDARNAFNCLSRVAMLAAVRRRFPHLLAYSKLCYDSPSPLFFRMERGHMHFWSREGPHQGDPLGCLYLSLPLQEVLLDLHRAHPDVVITAYIDDVILLGPPEAVRLAYLALVEQMAERLGLDSQPRKCGVYSPRGDISAFPQDMPGVQERADGCEVVGIPIGSDEYVRSAVLRKVRRLNEVIPLLDHLHNPQMQYLLLRCCAHPRVAYLLRGVVPALMETAAAEHDDSVWQSLQRILPGAPLSERSRQVANLHIRGGGLGLTSAERISPAAYAGSWALVAAPLADSCPLHLSGVVDMIELPAIHALHQAHALHIAPAAANLQLRRAAEDADLPPHAPLPESLPTLAEIAAASKTRAQRAYAAVLLASDWGDIIDGLSEVDRTWLLAVSHHSVGGQFLLAVPRNHLFTLTVAVFQTAMRHRLRETQPVALSVRRCGGCNAELDDTATHYVHCRGASGRGGGNYRTALHNTVQGVLAGMLRSVFPANNIRVEDQYGAYSYSPGHRPDITILNTGGLGVHTLVEVTVFRPTAPANLRVRRQVMGAALEARVAAKRATYGDIGPHRLLIFAVADYGMMSVDARSLLRECAVARGDRLDVEGRLSTWSCRSFSSFWLQRLSVALSQGIATCILLQAQRDWRSQ